MIKQVNRAAVDQRQQRRIEIGLGQIRAFIVDAVKAKALARRKLGKPTTCGCAPTNCRTSP
jgi:hypothetical protein